MFKISTFILFFLGITVSLAQSNEKIDILNETGQLNLQENFIASQGQTMIPSQATGNVVFIEQIGLDNLTSIQVTSSQSNIQVFQNGTENTVDLNYNAAEINSLVVQNGNNNSVTDYSFDPQGIVNTVVTQNGNDLNVQKFGSNSISNGLQINQTGSFKTITITSF